MARTFTSSPTFDASAVRPVLNRPAHQPLALLLAYGPMSLAGMRTGRLFFGAGALAAVLDAIDTASSPFFVPVLFLASTGIELQVPLGTVDAERVATVLLPTLLGVWLRSARPIAVGRLDPLYAAGGSLAYLALPLAVLGTTSEHIGACGWSALLIGAAAVALPRPNLEAERSPRRRYASSPTISRPTM